MNEEERKLLADGLNKLGKIAKDKGMTLTFHHHMGTVVQTEEEIDKFIEVCRRATRDNIYNLIFNNSKENKNV